MTLQPNNYKKDMQKATVDSIGDNFFSKLEKFQHSKHQQDP